MSLVQDVEEVKKYDNFSWQVAIIKKIQSWALSNDLNADDAFRAIDHDFDGFLSKSDLEYFLIHILHEPSKEVTSPVIDRLFKLMD